MLTKVKSINSEFIIFDNNYKLYSYHDSDCCEDHFLCFKDLLIEDFEDLTFDLSGEDWFKKIDGFGIELIPTQLNSSVKIAGYGTNNGYYSTNLHLILEKDDGSTLKFDIEECQNITEY